MQSLRVGKLVCVKGEREAVMGYGVVTTGLARPEALRQGSKDLLSLIDRQGFGIYPRGGGHLFYLFDMPRNVNKRFC